MAAKSGKCQKTRDPTGKVHERKKDPDSHQGKREKGNNGGTTPSNISRKSQPTRLKTNKKGE